MPYFEKTEVSSESSSPEKEGSKKKIGRRIKSFLKVTAIMLLGLEAAKLAEFSIAATTYGQLHNEKNRIEGEMVAGGGNQETKENREELAQALERIREEIGPYVLDLIPRDPQLVEDADPFLKDILLKYAMERAEDLMKNSANPIEGLSIPTTLRDVFTMRSLLIGDNVDSPKRAEPEVSSIIAPRETPDGEVDIQNPKIEIPASKVKEILATFPSGWTDNIHSVFQGGKLDGPWAAYTVGGDIFINSDLKTFSASSILTEVLGHEIGHNLRENLPMDVGIRVMDALLTRLKSPDRGIMHYLSYASLFDAEHPLKDSQQIEQELIAAGAPKEELQRITYEKADEYFAVVISRATERPYSLYKPEADMVKSVMNATAPGFDLEAASETRAEIANDFIK